jgi:hypothetical protein
MTHKTCLPSKLIEFAQFGKPLIIWGPEYCSAVQWSGDSAKCLSIKEESASKHLKSVESLSQNLKEQRRLAEETCKAASGEFDPRAIQQQFFDFLNSIKL